MSQVSFSDTCPNIDPTCAEILQPYFTRLFGILKAHLDDDKATIIVPVTVLNKSLELKFNFYEWRVGGPTSMTYDNFNSKDPVEKFLNDVFMYKLIHEITAQMASDRINYKHGCYLNRLTTPRYTQWYLHSPLSEDNLNYYLVFTGYRVKK